MRPETTTIEVSSRVLLMLGGRTLNNGRQVALWDKTFDVSGDSCIVTCRRGLESAEMAHLLQRNGVVYRYR